MSSIRVVLYNTKGTTHGQTQMSNSDVADAMLKNDRRFLQLLHELVRPLLLANALCA